MKLRVSEAKTRPSNTTAYTAKDAVTDLASASATAWVFEDLPKIGEIVAGSVLTDQATNTETFRLHLYNAPPTPLQDNAACVAPLYADAESYVGSIDFPACRNEGTGAAAYANATPSVANSQLPLPYASANGNLYGILEAVLGFTPASAQKFTVTLQARPK